LIQFGRSTAHLLAKIFPICFVVIFWITPAQSQLPDVDALVSQMSLPQKVAQMFMVSFFGPALHESAQDLLEDWQPGGVVLLPSNLGTPEQITTLTNDIQRVLVDSGAVPALIAVDQEGGIIARLKDGFTEWPVPMLLTATQNPDLAYQFGQAVAAEMQAVGINMNLAPVADLHTNPQNPIIGRRSYGTFPEQVNPILAAVVQGMESGGVLAAAKHFPGHGDTGVDSHLTLPVINANRQMLFDRELLPFQSLIDVNIASVMVGHLSLPELEQGEGLPASLSQRIITDLLRTDLAYSGLIMTDALDMDAIDTVYSAEEAVLMAIEAGNDVILVGAHIGPQIHRRAMQAVVDAVANGYIAEARIDESLRRILKTKARFGLLHWQPLEPEQASVRINIASSSQLIDSIFAQGITVVHGDEDLPLSGRVTFIYPGNRFSLWSACQADEWSPISVSDFPTDFEIEAARIAAQQAEHIVVFTQNIKDNAQQQALIESLPPEKTWVIALQAPDDIHYIAPIRGYIVTYSPLKPAHEAVCSILHGERPATGSLAIALD